jgi:predicted alpha/beta-hydrolase family hydrolase
MATDVTITGEPASIAARWYESAEGSAPVLVLAHGAGAGQRSPFMVAFAEAMRARGVATLTFDFPYMQQQRRVPDRAPVLEGTWRRTVQYALGNGYGHRGLVIGGKSMGGRIASHVLGDPDNPLPHVAGLVLLGYPLHAPGRPDLPRVAHLPALRTPTLVVQGSNDAFGTEDEVRRAFEAVPAPVEWVIVPGGDHSFKVPRSGDRKSGDALQHVYDPVARWVRAQVR